MLILCLTLPYSDFAKHTLYRLDRGEFFGRDFGAGQSAIYFLETAKGGPKFSWATSCGTIHLLAVGEKQGWPSQDVMKRYHGTAALEWVAKHQPLVPGTIIRWRENIDNRP